MSIGQSNNVQLNSFYNKTKEKCMMPDANTSLCKAMKFFLENQYDSCYIYCSKGLEETSYMEDRDALHYLQGASAIHKNLYEKALLSMKSISGSFAFYSIKELKLGEIYLELEDFDNAIECYQNWIGNNENTENAGPVYHNLGIAYLHKEDFDLSEMYLLKELELEQKQKDTAAIITATMDLANLYYTQYLDEKAIPLFEKSYQLSSVYSNQELKQNASLNMAIVEENRKNFESSLRYRKMYEKWKDSIWNRDKIWALTEKDKQMIVSIKEKELQVEQEKLKVEKKLKNALLIGSILLAGFLLLISYFYRIKLRQNNIISKQSSELDALNKIKDYMFSVVSHDLRSPVNALRKNNLILLKHLEADNYEVCFEIAKANSLTTENTYRLLNNVLNWSLEQSKLSFFEFTETSLNTLIKQVLYDYEQYAVIKKIAIHEQTDSSIIVKADRESIKIVFRNLLDNALKYSDHGSDIHISTKKINNTLCSICIENEGRELNQETLQFINSDEAEISANRINRSEGVGLGLVLCKTLIRKNLGVFSAENNKYQRVSMIVKLTLATET